MSDNVTLNAGSGGDTIAADDVGGAKYQRVKVCHGVDGAAADVSASSPLETAPTDPTATTGTLTAVDAASTSGTNAITQGYYTGTPTSGSHVDVALSGHNMVEFQVSGTASLTFACERSLDGGTTWYQAPFEALDGLLLTSQAISDNKPYGFRCNVGGCTNFRVRCTAYTSGTANVKIQPSFCLGQVWARQGIPNSTANAWPIVAAGDVAHDGADSGNPVKVGGKASTAVSGRTSVADGDRIDFIGSEDGVQMVRPLPAHPADYFDASPTTITSSTSDTSIQASGGSGNRNYMTGVIIRNSSATNTGVILKDGSGGTAKAHIPVPASGGVVVRFDPPLRGSAATAWYAACQDSVASIYITPLGYKSKV